MALGVYGIIYLIFYLLVLFCSFIGNFLIMVSVIRFKKMRKVVNVFLANLALADLLFSILSIFNGIAFFLGEWKVGNVICKIHGMLIEVSYTVSVLTLVGVAVERYMSICRPQHTRRSIKQTIQMIVFIWFSGFAFCAVLAYGYTTIYSDNKYQCGSYQWSNQVRLIFYITHSFLVYLLPLTLMCFSHYKICQTLAKQKQRLAVSQNVIINRIDKYFSSNSDHDEIYDDKGTRKMLKPEKANYSRTRIIHLLLVVTSIFFVLWTPFIIIRIIKYSQVDVSDYLWRASQLLMFTTTAVNIIVYALMSPLFRKAFFKILSCKRDQENASWSGVESSY